MGTNRFLFGGYYMGHAYEVALKSYVCVLQFKGTPQEFMDYHKFPRVPLGSIPFFSHCSDPCDGNVT